IQHYGSVVETTEAEWDRVLSVNLKSIFLCSKYCIPEIQKRGGGAVINVASVQGMASQERVAPYSATKGGAISLTRNMAIDFASSNIRVNCVCPGSIDTPLLRAAAELTDDPQATVREWGGMRTS
ncbi:MAG: SDR family NAD(P)-dependent oxidoreductase, partial [Candidatus Poribacteria bacterium]